MARKKRNPLDYISLPRIGIDLDPDIKKGIFIVLILALGAIGYLSLFDLAGIAGIYLYKAMAFAFGWGRWVIPGILLVWGFVSYNEEKYEIKGANYVGLFLFILTFHGLLQLFVSQNLWQTNANAGEGGGYVGLAVASALVKIMGFWACLIIIICLLLISLMLIFNATLMSLISRVSWMAKIFYPFVFVFNKIFKRGEKEEGEDEEEEENDEEKESEEDEEEEEDEEGAEDVGFKRSKVKASPAFMKEKEEPEEWKPTHVKIDLPLDLLSGRIGKPTSGDIKTNLIVIQRTLENFGIPVEMGEVNIGPTVTQYTLKPAEGIKLSRITALNNDLSLSLAAHPIRIEAPIPGKSLVGVEVPNQAKAIVGLKEILSDSDFNKRKNNLAIALGKDVSGKAWFDYLNKMPHLLVAGATGSGKSVMLNSIIVSLLYQNNPDDLRFIMVDPKRVELLVYNGIPHLLTPVITDVGKTINALKWCLNEMDRRFDLLAKHGRRNIDDYNNGVKNNDSKIPYIIFVIDELADLMVAAARDIEGSVIRLAQMSRAVGIHLVLATQRPSVDVITGLIKANMPARIAFSVASSIDSRTILDAMGAEKLLGRGDMLFVTAELSKPKRIQGAFVSDSEIRKIVRYIKEQGGEPNYSEGIVERQKVRGFAGFGMNGDGRNGDGDDDDLFEDAKEIVINMDKASASLLQRRLRIGYARAARLLDQLEDAGIIGPGQGAKPREVLISKEQYDNMISQGVSGVNLHKQEEAEAPEEFLDTGEEEGEEENEEENKEEDENDSDKKSDDAGEEEGKYFSR